MIHIHDLVALVLNTEKKVKKVKLHCSTNLYPIQNESRFCCCWSGVSDYLLLKDNLVWDVYKQTYFLVNMIIFNLFFSVGRF